MKIKASELEYTVFDHTNMDQLTKHMCPGNMIRVKYNDGVISHYFVGEINEAGGTGSEFSALYGVDEVAFAAVVEIEDE